MGYSKHVMIILLKINQTLILDPKKMFSAFWLVIAGIVIFCLYLYFV